MMDAPASDTATATSEVVLGLWQALARHDWDGLKTHLAADCLYVDMPMPAAAARGPEDIVKRLRLLFDRLAGYEHHGGRLVADGADVMYEHSETWHFPSGEQGTLRFATVHRVVDGKITVWKDYWDFSSLLAFAPPNYFDSFGADDMSWVFDATDLL
jgi:limonene-1,2-epoxide hydrolase